MNTGEVIVLLGAFWIMMMCTFIIAVYVVKDKTPEIVKSIKNVIPKQEEINEVEVITDEMEADIEGRVMNEYYTRF